MKKNVFMYVNYFMDRAEIGTTKRISAEISTLRELGYEVYYTAYFDDGVRIFDNHDIEISFLPYKMKNEMYIRAFRRNALCRISINFLNNNSFSYCLLRLNALNHIYVTMLKQMKKQNAKVLMIVTNYFPEIGYRDMPVLGWPIIFFLKRHKRDFYRLVDLVLTEDNTKSFFGVPCVRLSPGVVVDDFRKHNYTGDKNELNLIMVGCDSIYHGTDRILKSMYEYYRSGNKRAVNLHLVGRVKKSDIKKIEKYHLTKHVRVYGYLSGKALDDIYDKANIGLGPLAQFRSKKKDTGLKTKEYMAKGIPFVSSMGEEGIDTNFPYIYIVSDDESCIDLNTLFLFYDNIKNDSDMVNNMREMAKQKSSWKSKYKDVFEKLESVNMVN